LFLSAGSIIHIYKNEQDIRKLNNLFNKSPFVSIVFIIGSLSLMGVPHLSGYYSKDAIICLSRTYDANLVIFLSTIVGVITTTFYSIRLFYYLFYRNGKSRRFLLTNYKTNYANVVPLTILAFMSIFSGYFTKVFFIGLGNNTFNGSIFTISYFNQITSELIFDNLKFNVILFSMILTVLLSILFVIKRKYDRLENNFTYYTFSRDTFMFF